MFEPYDEESNEAIDGITFYPDFPGYMIPGESFTFRVATYSSTIGRNGPVTYDVVEPDGSATDKATINAETGELIAAGVGQIKVRAHYSGSPWVYVINAKIEESLEGTYFIQNKQHSMSLQPSNQNTMELRSFDGDSDQRWEIIYVSDGYYKIQSEASGKVIAVTSGKEDTNNHALVQEDYSEGSDRQLWKFTKSSRGNYVIRPKSRLAYSKDYCMGAGDYFILGDGLNVNQRLYTDDTELRDEWYFTRCERCSETPLEGQRWTNWCWVTSARMLVNHYSSVPDDRTQNNAVNAVYGVVEDSGGSHTEAIEAASYYYANNISVNSLNLVGDFQAIFSEDTLRRLLDDGHVVYIGRGLYDKYNNRLGGHASLIVGYTTVNVKGTLQYRYIIYDPWPETPPSYWESPQITTGQVKIRSYQWICNGQNALEKTHIDNYIWDRYVVVQTDYTSNTLSPVYN